MDAYVMEVRKLENKFSGLEIHHVIRDNNVGVDLLSKLGSTRAQVPAGVFVQELQHPSIKTPAQSTIDSDWREPYIDFIKDQRLPVGVSKKSAAAARIMRRSNGFILVADKLYKCGARSGVLMKCVMGEDGYSILNEIHDGSCGNNAASKTLVGKAYRAGFYWPTEVSDAEDLVRRCPNCQFFGK
jgi:hypothetical protein